MPPAAPSPAPLRRLLRAGFVLALGAVFVLALLPAPDLGKIVSWQDKIEHALLFFALARWGLAAWPRQTAALAFGLLGYGVAMELAQALTTYRQGDVWDALADALGVAAAVASAHWRRAGRGAHGRA